MEYRTGGSEKSAGKKGIYEYYYYRKSANKNKKQKIIKVKIEIFALFSVLAVLHNEKEASWANKTKFAKKQQLKI